MKAKFRKTREEKKSFWNITHKTNISLKDKGVYGIKKKKDEHKISM